MRIFVLISALILCPAAAWAQCDGILVVQQGPDLILDHGLDYNCAVHTIELALELDGDTLRVSEDAVADGWMDCYCPYRSNLVISGLEPGEYMLVWGYGERVEGEEPSAWLVCETSFVMADPAGSGEVTLAAGAEGCGIVATGVPAVEERTWSTVKARFH